MTIPPLRRGTVVTMASPGGYSGKPRAAVVVQADHWLQAHPSVTFCPLTSTLKQATLVRITVEPSPPQALARLAITVAISGPGPGTPATSG